MFMDSMITPINVQAENCLQNMTAETLRHVYFQENQIIGFSCSF